MLGARSAAETMGYCANVFTHASPQARAQAATWLHVIEDGQLPFSTVLRLERTTVTVNLLGAALDAAEVARLPASARACVDTGRPARGPKERIESWLLLPTYWQKTTDLERISVTDPLLESPAVRTALESSPLEDWLHEPPSDYPHFARRYANVSRKTDALLALLQALDGRTPPTFPWMKLSVTDAHVHLEVLLDEGWKTFDVDR